MKKYFEKEIDRVIEVNGNMFAFTKEKIEKSFSFSYHDSYYNNDSYENAQKKATNITEDYFIDENMKKINREIKMLNMYTHYVLSAYNGLEDNSVIKAYMPINKFIFDGEYRKMTEEEKTRILETLEDIKNDRMKKLKNYLKRNGLEKIKADIYWADR